MELKKVEWFYQIIVDSELMGTVEKLTSGENKGKWLAYGKDNWLYVAKTRKEAVENMLEGNRSV